MKIRLPLALLALAIASLGSAAPAAPADASGTSAPEASDEGPQPDAKRIADEKTAADAASATWTTIEQANPKHLPAFPGAEGFGALATGGRGGEIVHVTNLNDQGPGSFREAVSQPKRIVVFDVGGLINLESNLDVAKDITILGQTAPGEGICLYGRGVSLASNDIVRYLRFREGIVGDRGRKSLGMDKSSNIIVDHCSIEWGRWDDLGITVGSNYITIQNCLMAEGIDPQSFGALIDTVTNVSLSHDLWMSNESRNPKVKGSVQVINNVMYNWGGTGLCGGHSGAVHTLDIIGNYFIKGPSSNDRFAGEFFASDHVYQKDNYVDLDLDGKLNGVVAKPEEFHRANEKGYVLPTFMPTPALHPVIPVTIDTAADAYAKVAASAGCSLHRDPVDLRLISELASLGKKGATIPHTDPKGEALAGGLGEIKGGTAVVDPGKTQAEGGYMAIEVYANNLVAPTPAAK